jgi:hypothetical protein
VKSRGTILPFTFFTIPCSSGETVLGMVLTMIMIDDEDGFFELQPILFLNGGMLPFLKAKSMKKVLYGIVVL